MVTSKQSVFLFIGNDKYLKARALNDLKLSLPESPQYKSDLKVYYGREIDIAEVLDQLNTASLLSDSRLIVIKDADEIPDELRMGLIRYIKKPSKSVWLVLDSEDEAVLKDYDEVTGFISVRNFAVPVGSSLNTWIKDYIRTNGKAIEDKALVALRELEGNDLSYLSQELDKLIAFTGDRTEITSGDVDEVIGRSLIVSAFEISNSIGRRDTSGAIKIASDLIMSGKKEFEIIGILCWHLKRMFKAKVMKGKGESDYNIASSLRMGRRFQEDFFRQLASFNSNKIKADIELLLQADLDIKNSKLHPSTILEFALIRLCLT